jgi:phosphohistidine phosphatase
MNLILWRHAEAEKSALDQSRKLTPRGIEQARAMAAWLIPRLPTETRILVSPAQRTLQTADLLHVEYTIVDALYSSTDCESLMQRVDWPEGEGNVLIVGHQPTLGELAATILTGRGDSWEIEPSGLWWFESTPLSGRIQVKAAMSPELL